MKNTLLISVIAFMVMACDDVFEQDLTNSQIKIIAPSDGLTVEPGEVRFLWHDIKGATSYHLWIVREQGLPVADVVLHNDSTVMNRSYKCQLGEGVYLWSVKASNSAYETNEITLTLIVATSKQ